MTALSLAPYPPLELKQRMVPDEWALCMDSWLILTQKHLLLSSQSFQDRIQDPSLVNFLLSYVKNTASSDDTVPSAHSATLRKRCFLLVHRTMKVVKPIPVHFLEYSFLADLAVIYKRSQNLTSLLDDTWTQKSLSEDLSVLKAKTSFSTLLEAGQPMPDLERELLRAFAISKACYLCAQFFMTGSELIDAISTAHDKQSSALSLRKKLVALAYVCMTSLMRPENPKLPTMIDHLFSLQSTALIREMIASTPFYEKFQRYLVGKDQEAKRARPLLENLASSRRPVDGKPRKTTWRKIDKGKGKAPDGYEDGVNGTVRVHRWSLISQIQDLFPDLGSAFIVKLLDEYEDDTEQVTAHLLDDDLPNHLKQADRTESLIAQSSDSKQAIEHDLVPELEPQSTPQLPSRNNIFDDDEFDRLVVDASKVHLGRKNKSLTADNLLNSERSSTHKAAILSALAAFDSDDDERDDTYDAEDVGGTIDNTEADASARGEKYEEVLYNAYKMTPNVFSRDTDTRRSKARIALKTETGMTDEAIEGWALMLSREARRLQRLERMYDLSGGSQQRALAGSSWKAESGAEGTDDSDRGAGEYGGPGGGGGRGRGRGRGGRGFGSVAGPADNRETQVARQRKDANKGSRANHNRRDQRARKMARGGFPG